MNKARRARISEVKEELERLSSTVDQLRDEEQDYLDNIPENLQGSERAEIAEAAIEALEVAYDSIEDAAASLEEIA